MVLFNLFQQSFEPCKPSEQKPLEPAEPLEPPEPIRLIRQTKGSRFHRFSLVLVLAPPAQHVDERLQCERRIVRGSGRRAVLNPIRDAHPEWRIACRAAERREWHGDVVEAPVLGGTGREMRDRAWHRADPRDGEALFPQVEAQIEALLRPRDDLSLIHISEPTRLL